MNFLLAASDGKSPPHCTPTGDLRSSPSLKPSFPVEWRSSLSHGVRAVCRRNLAAPTIFSSAPPAARPSNALPSGPCAGRALGSEFNRVRAGLSFYEFSENVELAARASLLPRRFGVDAIILFYDITTLPVAMGQRFVLKPAVGPVPDHPVRTLADVDQLAAQPDPESYRHIRDLLRLVRSELNGELPVLGFAGAPFTTATYCINTGKDMAATRRFAAEQPSVWNALMERLTTATVGFLRTLIQDGADAYQLFDSWAGMLNPEEYRHWAQPRHKAIFRAVNEAPSILFVKECPFLDAMASSGADVVSLGVRHDLAAARATIRIWFFKATWMRNCYARERRSR